VQRGRNCGNQILHVLHVNAANRSDPEAIRIADFAGVNHESLVGQVAIEFRKIKSWIRRLSFAAACVNETIARLNSTWEPFATREAVRMSRGPHFSSNAKAEKELGYEIVPIDSAIRDAVADFAARGLVPLSAPATGALTRFEVS